MDSINWKEIHPDFDYAMIEKEEKKKSDREKKKTALAEKEAKLKKEQEKLRLEKKRILQEENGKSAERRKRTRRLIQNGAVAESLLNMVDAPPEKLHFVLTRLLQNSTVSTELSMIKIEADSIFKPREMEPIPEVATQIEQDETTASPTPTFSSYQPPTTPSNYGAGGNSYDSTETRTNYSSDSTPYGSGSSGTVSIY